jgi:excisionase family DNA binding protein
MTVEQRDGAVIVSGQAAALLYRATLALILREHRDGLASPPLLHQLRRELYRAAMSPQRQEVASTLVTSPCWEDQQARDWCNSDEAAKILRLSRRQVQRLAASPGGLGAVRVGQAWMFHRARLLVQASERRARHDRAG